MPKHVRNELCCVGKIVLRGCRIVVPKSTRRHIFELAHGGHPGVVRTKQRIRTKVWWPGIDRDVERKIRQCHGCQLVSEPSNPEPMKRHELPVFPWQRITTDLLGPMPNGEYVLAIVDYYSRFVEIEILKSITATSVINSLNRIFAIFGYPVSLKTDNGRQFVSGEFESYLNECGIEHRTGPPIWPQSNGEIERQNRIMLKSMKIAHAQGKDWKIELYKSLLAYRTTPQETTGVSPSKLMFGREIRTKLPELIEEKNEKDKTVRDRGVEKKQSGKDYADHKRNA